MSDGKGKVEVVVMGETVLIDHDDATIKDIDQDMDRVAAQMSRIAELWAAAEEEEISADAHYRAWRATQGEGLLQRDEKLAEWKVRQKIEASPKFTAIKDRLAKAARNVTVLKGHFESLKVKASLLQSKGAMRRAELDSTGMSTKLTAAEVERDVRKEKAKAAFAKSKRSTLEE